MSVVITDELRLLIKAEAEQAIRETKTYRENVKGATKAHADLSISAKSVTKDLLSSIGAYASVGAAMTALIRYGTQASAVYTETQGDIRKFEITYRDVLKEAEGVTLSWAKTFNYAESTAKKIMGSAGDIYTGMGIAASGALDLADQTAYLGGALSKLNPQLGSAAEATQALISGATGEREALKRWGIIIQEAAVQQKLLERGQKDLAGSALLAAKAQAVLDIAYEQSPNALNAVANTAELVADTNRYLSETWKEHLELTGQVIGEGLQPLKKAIADVLKERNRLTRAEREANEVGIDTDIIQGYTETSEKIKQLVDEYESLRDKTELTISEQSRLKEVVADISEIVPGAATSWNEYGAAIDISTKAAREYAAQQVAWAKSEKELQLMRLEFQAKEADEDQKTAAVRRKEISVELAGLEDEYNARKRVKDVAEKAKQILGTNNYAGAADFLRDNQHVFDELAKVTGSAGALNPRALDQVGGWETLESAIMGAVGSYDRINEKRSDLISEEDQLEIQIAEYQQIVRQIQLYQAELDYLQGQTEDMISILEDQAQASLGSSREFSKLRGGYARGMLSADDYRKALEALIETAGTPVVPDTSNSTKWTEFISKLTDGAGLDSAIEYEVALSPIIEDTGTTKLEAQLDYYEDLIQDLWGNKDQFGSLEEWQSALDELVPKYETVKSQIDNITKAEKQKATAKELEFGLLSDQEKVRAKLAEYENDIVSLVEAGLLTDDQRVKLLDEQRIILKDKYGITKDEEAFLKKKEESQKLIRSLLSKEKLDALELIEYEKELVQYKELGLLTEEQVNALLEKRKNLQDDNAKSLKEQLEDLGDEFISIERMGELLSDTFADIGAAMASGEDFFQESTKALQEFTSQILKELSLIATTAGLRAIAEGGLAAVPLAIGLFALGGVAGIGSGFFGSSGSGVDSSIMESLSGELKVRESLNDALRETLDLEMDMLRRQLDRNLISEDEYMAGVQDVWAQRNLGDAQAGALDLISDAMDDLDSSLSDMSGWTKFWTQKDENIEAQAAALKALAEQVNDTSDADALRALLLELEGFGVDIDALPAFAKGGSFITNGPQPILVGDNSSGREHVQITPLGSSQSPTPLQPHPAMVVNIYGDVIDYEDLYRKLDRAGVKVQRKMMKRVSA